MSYSKREQERRYPEWVLGFRREKHFYRASGDTKRMRRRILRRRIDRQDSDSVVLNPAKVMPDYDWLW
jgi:hypothetical protein